MQRIAAQRTRISSAAARMRCCLKKIQLQAKLRSSRHAPDEPRGDAHERVEDCPYRREDLVGRGEAGLGYARIPGGNCLGGCNAGEGRDEKTDSYETCQREPLIGRSFHVLLPSRLRLALAGLQLAGG